MTAFTSSNAWAILFKIANAAVLFVVLPWTVWATRELFNLRQEVAIVAVVQKQIAVNTETLARHEKAISATESALVALIRELGPLDQRIRLFVTRAEWELRNDTRDRELLAEKSDNRASHESISQKLDRQSEKLDRLIERMK